MLNRSYMQEKCKGHPKNVRCNAGDVSCVIDADGDVWLYELYLKPLGNLKAYNKNFKPSVAQVSDHPAEPEG